jgi:outer membrane lipoprotein-sorting protein
MSNITGIASAFVLSSLFLSPFAIAEESQTFVAQNAARAAAYDQYQSDMTAKAQDAAQTPQASTSATRQRVEKDS